MFQTYYKLVLGDFEGYDTVLTKHSTGSENYIWFVFFISTMVLMIIMLNLLIAFIGDSYNEVVH